jgi:F-type H+-transporting ATPase subunit delta
MARSKERELYSKALFNVSLSENKVDRVYQDMHLLHGLLLKYDSFNKFISNPVISIIAKERLFDRVFGTVLDETSFRFIMGLFRRRLHNLITDIIGDFIDRYKRYRNVVVVHISTVCVLNDDLRFMVRNLVERLTRCTDVELVEHLDSALIGGYKLRFDDFQLDRSVKFVLEKLLSLDYNLK